MNATNPVGCKRYISWDIRFRNSLTSDSRSVPAVLGVLHSERSASENDAVFAETEPTWSARDGNATELGNYSSR